MKADFLSYKRATSRSLLGLTLQVVMGLAILIYAIYGQDRAAMTAAAFVLVGGLVWLSLALVFDQHRRERLETMEAEAFAASDAAASSAFDQSAHELRIAAKRLRAMYRFFVPGAGLVIGGLLLGIGIWRFNQAWASFAPDEYAKIGPPRHQGWGIAVGAVCAFVGFVVARYIAGMAKQKVWENLRAGAAALVGAALLGIALAIAHVVDVVGGPDTVLRYLSVVFPLLMAVIGVEFLIYLVLELYRPRKPGEFAKPAFDSRILGFVAAPDLVARSVGEAISYQLGQDITSTWGYRLIVRIWKPLILMSLVVAWLMTSLSVVHPHQRALVLRFGDDVREIGPGLHFKLPWPIDRLEVPQYALTDERGRVTGRIRTATGVRTLNIGTAPAPGTGPILWVDQHGQQETFFLVRPAQATGGGTPEGPASEVSMAAVEVPLMYTIDQNLGDYEELGPPEFRDKILANTARRVLTQYMASLTISDVLAARRAEMAGVLHERINEEFKRINPVDKTRPVVNIVFVGVEGVHPPQGPTGDVARSYEEVIGAELKKQARLLDARARAIEIEAKAAGSVELSARIVKELDALRAMQAAKAPDPELIEQRLRIVALIQEAGGEAAGLINKASADRWARHMGERARLAAYQGRIGSYRAAPAIYRAFMYFDVLKESIGEARLYITDPVTDLRMRMMLEDRDTGVDVFDPNSGNANP